MMRIFSLVFGAALVFGLLVLPNHPGTMRWSALNRWPLELPVILCLMIVTHRVWGAASVVAFALVAAAVIKLADYGTFIAYNRTFDPIVDLFLIKAGFGLLRDSIGFGLTVAAVCVAVIAVVIVFFVVRRGLVAWSRLSVPSYVRVWAAIGVIGFGSWAVADAGHHLRAWRFDQSPPGTAWTTRLMVKRGIEMRETAADLVAFRDAAKTDPMANLAYPLGRLEGRDVLVIWLESYGRTSFDNPLYASTHGATLTAAEAELSNAGFDMRSGWLTSPTSGGQSWLAHGALASGLWTSDNARYDALIASRQKWLYHFARDAGYRTAAIMPAITLGWPESAAMGFDHVFAFADIPYEGERFNWVTIPDQFTLSARQSLLPDDDRPDFTQIALISSHAPWTPIPDVIAWEDIDDGTEFNEMAARGPAPKELWKDRDNVRDAYRQMIDYTLQVTFSYVARLGEEAPLVMVIGDHQPAGFVAGSENKDVAIHLIGPSKVLKLIDHWGFSPGLFPDPDLPPRRMDSFRDDFLMAFTSPAELAGAVQ